MKTFRSRFGVLCLVFSCCAAAWLGVATTPRELTGGGLVVPSPSLQLGEIWESEQFAFALPIENKTDSDILVDGFLASCSCLRITPQRLAVKARSQASVRVALVNLLKQRSSFDVTVSPLVRGLPVTSWHVTGSVRPALEISPAVAQFGELVAGPLQPKKVIVRNLVQGALISAACDSPLATARIAGTQGKPTECAVSISSKVLARPGPFSLKVRLTSTLPGGKKACKILLVQGVILSDVEIAPSSLTLGARKVGEVAEERILLQSITDQPIKVHSVQCNGEGLTIEPEGTSRRGEQTFLVRQCVQGLGVHSGSISIRAAGRQEAVQVSVSYYGIAVPR